MAAGLLAGWRYAGWVQQTAALCDTLAARLAMEIPEEPYLNRLRDERDVLMAQLTRFHRRLKTAAACGWVATYHVAKRE